MAVAQAFDVPAPSMIDTAIKRRNPVMRPSLRRLTDVSGAQMAAGSVIHTDPRLSESGPEHRTCVLSGSSSISSLEKIYEKSPPGATSIVHRDPMSAPF